MSGAAHDVADVAVDSPAAGYTGAGLGNESPEVASCLGDDEAS